MSVWGGQISCMLTSSADRRRSRGDRTAQVLGEQPGAALDALALFDLACHDCYGEPGLETCADADVRARRFAHTGSESRVSWARWKS